MKYKLTTLLAIVIFSCNTPQDTNKEGSKNTETYYGNLIDRNNIIDVKSAKNEIFKHGKITTKIKGEILETCAKKGCWMKLKTEEDTIMVRFKDYSFFVPKKGVEGNIAIINGEAFYDTLSVKLLQHYAEDAGKSEEDILSITEPKFALTFTADGVIIKE
tara:strand:- start:515 stop:994 length:480 start_codon:yes stop_codon:yes gene_type:complete